LLQKFQVLSPIEREAGESTEFVITDRIRQSLASSLQTPPSIPDERKKVVIVDYWAWYYWWGATYAKKVSSRYYAKTLPI